MPIGSTDGAGGGSVGGFVGGFVGGVTGGSVGGSVGVVGSFTACGVSISGSPLPPLQPMRLSKTPMMINVVMGSSFMEITVSLC
jgi:hypothetical protein